MQPTVQKPSKVRIILMWLLMVGVILFWVVFWLWRNHVNAPPPEEAASAPAGMALEFIASIIGGGFFLVAGGISYLIAVFTGCLTFNYQRSVWPAVKVKLFLANIVVLVLVGLGTGFLCASVLGPVLMMLGLDAHMARLVPVMLMIGAVQIVLLWVLVWSPLEKHIIRKRLAALGLKPEQLQGATLVGLSNPASGYAKRFGMIEEDMGALWVGPEQLIFWGDVEQFGIGREQIEAIERRADHRSTSMLGGIAHVLLHVRQSDGSVRQFRLHTEGIWTMGGKRRAMDALAEAIDRWYAGHG